MKFKSLFLGSAVAEALGVPVENKVRIILEQDPVEDMRGYETYNVPIGTFNDSTSMSWILAETIAEGYDINKLAAKTLEWRKYGKYSAIGEVLNISESCCVALAKYEKTGNPLSGSTNESENTNGSLMRIAPLILLLKGKKIEERFDLVKEVSSLTHRHNRSVLSCFFYCEFLLELSNGSDKNKAYAIAQNKIKFIFKTKNITRSEQNKFERIYPLCITTFGEKELETTPYVIHTLETALWCFMSTNTYKDAVLKAVNLGGDTDTIGAVTGAMAGLSYGYDSIPKEWLKTLQKHSELELLSDQLDKSFIL